MKVYIAAPYAARDHVRAWLTWLLPRTSLEVTSSWLDADHEIHAGTVDTAPDMPDEYAYQHSMKDCVEIYSADALILLTHSFVSQWGFTLAQTTSGGRHIETGYALAIGKPVIVVGEPENIFHRGVCTVVPDFASAIRYLKEI